MANRNTQGFPSPEEDPRFHDTYQFLRRYRDATYSLKVVVHQMEHQFKLQYDNDIDKFLDSMRHRQALSFDKWRRASSAPPYLQAAFQRPLIRLPPVRFLPPLPQSG